MELHCQDNVDALIILQDISPLVSISGGLLNRRVWFNKSRWFIGWTQKSMELCAWLQRINSVCSGICSRKKKKSASVISVCSVSSLPYRKWRMVFICLALSDANMRRDIFHPSTINHWEEVLNLMDSSALKLDQPSALSEENFIMQAITLFQKIIFHPDSQIRRDSEADWWNDKLMMWLVETEKKNLRNTISLQ